MSLFPADILELADGVLQRCRSRRLLVATAESCTGGLVAAALTEIAGSSDVVDRGFVTYSNAAKQQLLGVPEALITRVGAVSTEVADAMAMGALSAAGADLTVSITGVAGPGGGTPAKPVGLVHFATALRGASVRSHMELFGDLGRTSVRLEATRVALRLLQSRLD